MERRSLRAITLLIGFIVAAVLMLLGVTAIAADESVAVVVEVHDHEVKVPRLLNYYEVVKSIVYPKKCRSYGVEGTVYVKLLVGKDGGVKEYRIIRTPHRELTEACLSQLNRLVFSPARDGNGEFVEMWVGIPIKFKLEG